MTQEWHIYPISAVYYIDTPDSQYVYGSIDGCYAEDLVGSGGILTGTAANISSHSHRVSSPDGAIGNG